VHHPACLRAECARGWRSACWRVISARPPLRTHLLNLIHHIGVLCFHPAIQLLLLLLLGRPLGLDAVAGVAVALALALVLAGVPCSDSAREAGL